MKLKKGEAELTIRLASGEKYEQVLIGDPESTEADTISSVRQLLDNAKKGFGPWLKGIRRTAKGLL